MPRSFGLLDRSASDQHLTNHWFIAINKINRLHEKVIRAMSCYAVSIFMVTLLDLHRRPSSNEDFRRLGRAVSGILLSIFYKKNKAKSKSESVSFQASFHLDPMNDRFVKNSKMAIRNFQRFDTPNRAQPGSCRAQSEKERVRKLGTPLKISRIGSHCYTRLEGCDYGPW